MALTSIGAATNFFFSRLFAKPKINWKADDYYERLGLKKTATHDEIKKRYYEIAKAYHPDVLHTPKEKEEGEKIMSAVNSAYDVLKDEKTRSEYDHRSSSSSFPFVRTTREHSPMVFRKAVTLNFMESVFGCSREITLPTTEPCSKCNGQGTSDGKPPILCQYCHGSGIVAEGFFPFPCPACSGKGYTIEKPCHNCKGTGQTPKPTKIKINVPPGVENGSIINFSTPNGQLIVACNVKDDSIFERNGNDLHITVPISMKTAALGGIVQIPTLKGIVNKKVRPGTQPLDVEKMNGAGIGGRGSLYIHYKVIIPRSLSFKEKKAIKSLSDKSMKSTNDMYTSTLNQFENNLKKYRK
ncbi:Chaperone protein DnaJ 1 [Histomonas meleagridis]|uniref:Chaperone protein DnaJ 1 n=1 Tax=Histomonas meleagridis TaxID=135588 RepID=UPI00355AC32D|nr:Chaperone protein DnaJ 1 [Histomonas meleagridis]KAH0806288.1 Chaperone protein DnaJ 1 [Histomonas meleagridis]